MAMSSLAARTSMDLICAVCRGVYESPRFLPCHHTYCLRCIEGLASARGQCFMCPQCRKSVQVPPQGPQGFPKNFYIKEEELQLARKGPGNTICPIHAKDMVPRVLFCIPCDMAICIICKATKHESHQTEDIFEAAEKCIKPLEDYKLQLEKNIAVLFKKLQQEHENLVATELKSKALPEQVKHWRDLLVARIEKETKGVLKEVEENNEETKKQIETSVSTIQKDMDALKDLSHKVEHALKGDHADKVCAEKEMREGAKNMQTLETAINSMFDTTVRPVMRSEDNIADDVIRQYLGAPGTATITGKTSREVITPVVQLEKHTPCRRVHSLLILDENNMQASIGGMPPTYDEAVTYDIVQPEDDTSLPKKKRKLGKCSQQVHSGNTTFYCPYMSSESRVILAKGRAKFHAEFSRQSGHCAISSITTKSEEGQVRLSYKAIVSIRTGPMLAFDAQESGGKFVLIDEWGKKRKVRLYSQHESEPLAIYKSPDEFFYPMDVCFWHKNNDDKLLIADWHNDNVHVVDTTDNQLRFERYLAAGSGHLIRPTALNSDENGRVWIGCDNGWILRCDEMCTS